MKRINYLFGLMLGVGLFSCTDDQLLDEGQNGNKTYQKIEATMEVKNAVIGLPKEQKEPKTRGSQSVETTEDGFGILNYKEGQEVTTVLIVGMECDGKKAFMHIAGKHKICTENGRKYISLHDDSEGDVHLKDPANATGSESVITGEYDKLKTAYNNNRNDLKVYVSAVVGGVFDAKKAKTKYATTYDYDSEKPYETKDGAQLPFFTEVKDGSEYIAPMDIPMTTKGWEQIGSSRVQMDIDNKWTIDLSDIEINLKPSGFILSFSLKNNRKGFAESSQVKTKTVTNNDTQQEHTRILVPAYPKEGEMVPVDGWINAIEIDRWPFETASSTPGIIDLISKAYVGMEEDWNGKEDISERQSFIDSHKRIYLNRELGKMKAEGYSKPIYFWGQGSGQLYLTFYTSNLSAKGESLEDANSVIPFKKSWKYLKGGTEIGGNNGDEAYETWFLRDFMNTKEGASYFCKLDDDVEAPEGYGLIMTEFFFHPWQENYEEFTMVEVYNPTNNPIDLRDYGFIRYNEYKKYHCEGKGDERAGLIDKRVARTRFYDDKEDAKVQELYPKVYEESGENDFYDDVRKVLRWNGEDVRDKPDDPESEATNTYWSYGVWNDNIEYGDYLPKLGPKRTGMFLGGHWVLNYNFFTGQNEIPEFIPKMISKNLINKNCQFVVSLDNAKPNRKARGYYGNTGVLEMRWTPFDIYDRSQDYAPDAVNGLALIKRDKATRWKIVDVMGLAETDHDLVQKYAEEKHISVEKASEELYKNAVARAVCEDLKNDRGWDLNNKEYYYYMIRNDRPGDDRQNVHFINKDYTPIVGTNKEKCLWLPLYSYGGKYLVWGKKNSVSHLKEAFTKYGYCPSFGQRFKTKWE